jgi:hypothetical protein
MPCPRSLSPLFGVQKPSPLFTPTARGETAGSHLSILRECIVEPDESLAQVLPKCAVGVLLALQGLLPTVIGVLLSAKNPFQVENVFQQAYKRQKEETCSEANQA